MFWLVVVVGVIYYLFFYLPSETERIKAETERLKKERLSKEHNNSLDVLPKKSKEINLNKNTSKPLPSTSLKYKKDRVTHCHSCKSYLDSLSNIECDDCGWLICDKCGACEYDCSKTKKQQNKKKLAIATAATATTLAAKSEVDDKEDWIAGTYGIPTQIVKSSENNNDNNDNNDDYDDYDDYESVGFDDHETDYSVDYGYAEDLSDDERY